MRVRISKLSEVSGGAPADPTHVAGQDTKPGFSLPVDYYVEGNMTERPKVGSSFTMLRDNRNGISVSGVFQTSALTEVTVNSVGNITSFKTQNSTYKVENL